jgi:hypothetical protein
VVLLVIDRQVSSFGHMDKLPIATEKWLAARRSGRSLSPPDDEQLRQWWSRD